MAETPLTRAHSEGTSRRNVNIIYSYNGAGSIRARWRAWPAARFAVPPARSDALDEAAVDGHGLAREERRAVGAQQQHELDQVIDLPPALDQLAAEHCLLVHVLELGEHGQGGHHARRDADDADVVW